MCYRRIEDYKLGHYENKDIFLKWCKENNIKDYSISKNHWVDLKAGKRFTGQYRLNNVPFTDHMVMFRTIDNGLILTVQPYDNKFKDLRLKEIIDFCNDRGLEFLISKELSWYSEHTTLFQYKLKDLEKLKKYIKEHRSSRRPRFYQKGQIKEMI